MKDEIKGILDKLKDNDWYEELDLTGTKWIELTQEETNQLLNYITNLQQENEIKTTKLNAIRKYLLNNKLYTFKYDDEELFEITTDKKAKDDLLKILCGDEQ